MKVTKNKLKNIANKIKAMNKSDLWSDSSMIITDLTGNQNVSKGIVNP